MMTALTPRPIFRKAKEVAPELHGDDPAYLAKVRQLPTPEYLKSRIRYCADTGRMWWRALPITAPDWRRWNKRFAGSETAASVSVDGYRLLTVDDRQFKAHHIAWAIHHGCWPSLQIDHINGDRQDNRAGNLRLVTPKENARNRKRPSDNTSGYVGVSPTKYGTWIANISTDSGRVYLGSFKCLTAAAVARRAAEIRFGGYHENHGRAE